jgi:crotonobetainyl-CoA:carnitine CoA-transferase CaiB-like acyl-CoA transferase
VQSAGVELGSAAVWTRPGTVPGHVVFGGGATLFAPAAHGAHTADVLAEIEIDGDELRQLRSERIV